MVVDTYELALDNEDNLDSFTKTVQVGSFNMEINFTWPTVIQEQYDTVMLSVTSDRDQDPMIGRNTIVRDYDLLDYYVNQVPSENTLSWWEQQTIVPQSLSKLPSATAVQLLLARKTEYTSVYQMVSLWKEQLCWQCTIEDGVTPLTVLNLRIGGWTREQDNAWAVRFVASVGEEAVGRDNLGIVTMQFEVYDD